MKGITEAIRPFVIGGGRIQLETVRRFVMNSELIDENGIDFRTEKYNADITSALNAADFYATGDGEFTYIEDMTTEELNRTAQKLLKLANSFSGTAKKMQNGQISFDIETGEFIIPEPVSI